MSGYDLTKGRKNMKSMSRRDFMKGLAIAASASAIPAFAKQTRSTRPNVIILFIDDLAYGELGAFGCPDIPTPHMDSLAVRLSGHSHASYGFAGGQRRQMYELLYHQSPVQSESMLPDDRHVYPEVRKVRHGTRPAHPQ